MSGRMLGTDRKDEPVYPDQQARPTRETILERTANLLHASEPDDVPSDDQPVVCVKGSTHYKMAEAVLSGLSAKDYLILVEELLSKTTQFGDARQ